VAIISQLITPEEFARLDPETRDRINAFAKAGGAVAEVLDANKIPPHLVDSARVQRLYGAELRSARADVEKVVAEMTRRPGPQK
jgi:hypothetical protein